MKTTGKTKKVNKATSQYEIYTKMLETGLDEEMGYFIGLPTSFLVKAVNGEIDLNEWAKIALANRGFDKQGEWIGFEEAYKLFGISRTNK